MSRVITVGVDGLFLTAAALLLALTGAAWLQSLALPPPPIIATPSPRERQGRTWLQPERLQSTLGWRTSRPEAARAPRDPLHARLAGTVLSDVASGCWALLGPSGKAEPLQVGDPFADGVVASIEADRVGVRRGDRWEYVLLGGGSPGAPAPSTEPNALQITRGELEALKIDPTPLLTGARFAPRLRDGRADGVRVLGVVPGSFFERAGLHSGDVVLRVGAFEASNPLALAAHLPELEAAGRAEVVLERAGSTVELAVVLAH